MTPMLENLTDPAVRVTAAEAAHAKVAAAVVAAEEARNTVAARLADTTGRRQAIGLRRAEGRAEATDAEELAVLSADVDGLEVLLSRHEAAVAEARAPERAAADAAATARHALHVAEARATEEALTARAKSAAGVLLETVRQLRQVRDSLGGGLLPWRPDDALMSALVPVHNARPW